MVSAHEAALGDSRLVAPEEADAAELAEQEAEREAVRERLAKASKASTKAGQAAAAAKEEEGTKEEREEPEREGDEEPEEEYQQPPPPPPPPPPASTISSRRAAALEKGAVRSSALPLASAKQASAARVRERDAPLLTEWQRRHARFAARKKVTGKRDEATLRALDAFTARLRGSEGGGGGGGGSGTATNNNITTAAKAGAAVAAAAFIEQGDVSLREVAGHKMVALREDEGEDGR